MVRFKGWEQVRLTSPFGHEGSVFFPAGTTAYVVQDSGGKTVVIAKATWNGQRSDFALRVPREHLEPFVPAAAEGEHDDREDDPDVLRCVGRGGIA